MKKLKLMIVALALVAGKGVSAQDNVIKLRPSTLFFGNINLSYERAMPNGEHSFAINTGVLIPRKLPGVFVSDDELTGDVEVKNKIGGFALVPEYRFYTGGTALEGFYFGPYARFSRYSLTLNSTYDGYDAEAKGSYTTLGLGASIGYQWIIGNGFSIDWTFIGLGINRNTLGVKFTGDDPDINYQEWEDDITNEFGDVPLFGKHIKTEVEDNSISIKAPYFGLGFRTMFTLGYAF